MPAPKDPIKYKEYCRKRKEIAQRLYQNPEYRRKNKEAMQKRAKDPEYQHIQKEAIRKRSQNPKWKHNHKKAMQKRALDPKWLHENKEMCQKRSSTQKWIDNNKKVGRENAQNPEWKRKHKKAVQKLAQDLKWQLKQKEGKLGGFWYGNVRYPDRPRYCNVWGAPFWRRIDEAQNYQSILSGKTKEDNIGRDGKPRALSRHHVYWQKKACCEWDEDARGYYAWIDIGTPKKPNRIKYYIPGDPNKFVLLTMSEHDMVKKDKLKWIKTFEDLIETKLGGVCYLPKDVE